MALAVAIVVVAPSSSSGADDDGADETAPTVAESRERPRAILLSDRDRDRGPAREMAVETTDSAVAAAAHSSLGRRQIPASTMDYRQILEADFTDRGSLSVGTIRDGGLQNASVLSEEGDYHQIIERHRSRNTNYGTEELVRAIEDAAREVADEFGGAPLRVGNLGYRHGGPIPWSSSHEAGRDADIAFYAIDDHGDSVPTPDLLAFDDEGRAENGELHFDVPRNWALVRSLLDNQEITVQWMFISIGLKVLLIEHAMEIDEDPEIIEQAIKVLHQPTDAPPHDDHLHLRIACSEADRLAGCIDWGPHWEWHHWHKAALFARTRTMQRAFDDPSPTIRTEALDYLYTIRSPFASEVALQYGITDPDEEVREQAFEILDELSLSSDAGVVFLAQALEADWKSAERKTLYDALRRAHSPRTTDLAMSRYRDRELSDEERELAIEALAHRIEASLIPELLQALRSEESPQLRAHLARQLYRIAARSDGVDWADEELSTEYDEALAQWKTWWDDERDRRHNLEEFALERGADEWKDLEAIDGFIAQLPDAEDWEFYNLNRLLSRWTGRWAPRDWNKPDDGYRFWTRWWDRNRDRFLNPQPKPWVDDETP